MIAGKNFNKYIQIVKLFIIFSDLACMFKKLFSNSSGKAYNGMCLVIIKADKGASGTITVKGESEGLKGA